MKSVLGKLRFRDGLVWTIDLNVEIKLRFLDGLVWTVGLDGLVWTVGLNVETMLRFRDGLVWTVGLSVEKSCFFKFLRFEERFGKATFS